MNLSADGKPSKPSNGEPESADLLKSQKTMNLADFKVPPTDGKKPEMPAKNLFGAPTKEKEQTAEKPKGILFGGD